MFKHLSVKRKIILTGILIITLMTAASLFTLNKLKAVDEDLALLGEEYLPALQDAEKILLSKNRVSQLVVLAYSEWQAGTFKNLTAIRQETEIESRRIGEILNHLNEKLHTQQLSANLTEQNKVIKNELQKINEQWAELNEAIIALLNSARNKKFDNSLREAYSEWKKADEALNLSIGNLTSRISDIQLTFIQSARSDKNSAILFSSILLAASIILGLILTLQISRNLKQQLDTVIETTEEIARGNTQVKMTHFGENEMGKLAQAIQIMTEELEKVAVNAQTIASGDLSVEIKPRSEKDFLGKALNEMLRSLRAQINEIRNGISVLASTASEVTATIAQISASSSETATAITETATTIQEVRQTAEISSRRAEEVTKKSRRAVEVSRSGEQAVLNTIEGMNEIREQMQSIATSIVRLSEQSQDIGNIMDTVSDIAEQTNLLAVNAAIEAAKAGEHGRGFAVVAQEIRNLAEQSKNATIQVHKILKDIQNSTSTAVMATEQGTKSVEKGVNLAEESGESIQALSQTVEDTVRAVMEIANSIKEQFVGVEQVNEAIENIQTASSQNLEGMNQLEESIRNLQDLGGRLKELVDKYHL
ncbi:MAG: hypothetical protein Kow0037_21830 [Calditrichia bacterium]